MPEAAMQIVEYPAQPRVYCAESCR
jgi:hypothetical protein